MRYIQCNGNNGIVGCIVLTAAIAPLVITQLEYHSSERTDSYNNCEYSPYKIPDYQLERISICNQLSNIATQLNQTGFFLALLCPQHFFWYSNPTHPGLVHVFSV